MNDRTENLVLEHLRALRLDITGIKNDVRDMKARLASIESYIATLHADSARGSVSIDALQQRVERIEARLDLNDA